MSKILTKNNILIATAVIAILIVGFLILGYGDKIKLPNIFVSAKQKVAEKAVKYINDSGLSSVPVSLVSVSEESGLIKIKIEIGGQEFDSYVTKDGKLLFPQGYEIETDEKDSSNNNQSSADSATKGEIVKKDSPVLEAFIVSRCPFGLQMQRIIADAINTIPKLAEYVKVKYMGSVSSDGKSITAMHGDAEAQENLRQICIREEQPARYWPYVSCQMKAGDTSGCEASAGVNLSTLNACILDRNRGVAYAKEDFDLSDKYRVSGSPTLILNEANVSEFDYGGRTSDALKSVVCAGFNSEPSFCSTELNTNNAAASFSGTYVASGQSGGDATCQ